MISCYQRQDPFYRFPDSALLIFCKAPAPGQVKTRLTPALSPEQAAAVHAQLATATLQLATARPLCPVQLWCAPDTEHGFFKAAAQRYPLTLHSQQGEDLGARMQHAIASALIRYSQAVIIGCDCPSLTTTDLECALQGLQQGLDVVLAPAEDGGYVLIGCNRLHPGLFTSIPWSSAQVLNATRARISLHGLSCLELDTHWDVDDINDYLRYQSLPRDAAPDPH